VARAYAAPRLGIALGRDAHIGLLGARNYGDGLRAAVDAAAAAAKAIPSRALDGSCHDGGRGLSSGGGDAGAPGAGWEEERGLSSLLQQQIMDALAQRLADDGGQVSKLAVWLSRNSKCTGFHASYNHQTAQLLWSTLRLV
jgi:hypothetical protein